MLLPEVNQAFGRLDAALFCSAWAFACGSAFTAAVVMALGFMLDFCPA
jgi:hypothetical protein